MNDKQKILKVAIDVPINQLFDYLPNDEPFSIGQYVTIPFGRRKMIGVIYKISLDSDIHPSKLKSIINVMENNRDTQHIIQSYLRKNKVQKILKLE